MRKFCPGIFLGWLALVLSAQDLREFEKRVTEFTLPNGLHFIVIQRQDAPVISFHTYVRAGAVDDPPGKTGLAHLFERLAFKGTDTIGTRDWPAEKKALDAIEEAYDRLDAERNRVPAPDVGKAGAAQIQLDRAIAHAQSFAKPGEYTRILEENGGVGISAVVAPDAAWFACSLPSNRLELWFLMESQRLQRPVYREFYTERDAVADEYRQRLEASPQEKLTQALLSAALSAHPFRNPLLGWPADVANLRRGDAQAFFDRYYVPGNMNITIVGDVDPAEARRLADRYFGPMPARPMPPRVHTTEAPQTGPRSIVLESAGQPMVAIGWRRPSSSEPEDPALDIIRFIIAGRAGWLYRTLVEDKRIAAGTLAVSTYPGARYTNLFFVMSQIAAGHTADENQKAIDEIMARLANETVDNESLARAKAEMRALFLSRIGANAGLGFVLATYQGVLGNWRELFRNLDNIDRVTPADVQSVARRFFTPSNRTLAYTLPPPQTATARPAAGVRP